jgi:hypothetical protein
MPKRDIFLELMAGVAEMRVQRLYDTGRYKDLPKPRISRGIFHMELFSCYSGKKSDGTLALGVGTTELLAYNDWLDVLERGPRRDLP